MVTRRPALVLVCLVLAAAPASCAGSRDEAHRGSAETAASPAVRGEVTVFAASSLSEAFEELGDRFEAAHPGTSVTFNFGASSALARQIEEGAPADVFAAADEVTLEDVRAAGRVDGQAHSFAQNSLAILVAPGNPKGVEDLDDLASPELVVVLCAEQVPCGRYARQVLDDAGVVVAPKSYEENVKGVVTKVMSGEADAGIVYVTDARAAGDEAGQVAIPAAQNAVATYPIAALRSAPNPRAADAFVSLVRSGAGRRVLARFGFGPP